MKTYPIKNLIGRKIENAAILKPSGYPVLYLDDDSVLTVCRDDGLNTPGQLSRTPPGKVFADELIVDEESE